MDSTNGLTEWLLATYVNDIEQMNPVAKGRRVHEHTVEELTRQPFYKNCILHASEETFAAENACIYASNSRIHAKHCIIEGVGNNVVGDYNIIAGEKNSLHRGEKNCIFGQSNNLPIGFTDARVRKTPVIHKLLHEIEFTQDWEARFSVLSMKELMKATGFYTVIKLFKISIGRECNILDLVSEEGFLPGPVVKLLRKPRNGTIVCVRAPPLNFNWCHFTSEHVCATMFGMSSYDSVVRKCLGRAPVCLKVCDAAKRACFPNTDDPHDVTDVYWDLFPYNYIPVSRRHTSENNTSQRAPDAILSANETIINFYADDSRPIWNSNSLQTPLNLYNFIGPPPNEPRDFTSLHPRVIRYEELPPLEPEPEPESESESKSNSKTSNVHAGTDLYIGYVPVPAPNPPRDTTRVVPTAQDESTDNEDLACKICLTNKARIMIRNCNHMCMCRKCAVELYKNCDLVCPLCKQPISGFFLVFV